MEVTLGDNAMCRRIWEQLWQFPAGSQHTCGVRSDGHLVCFGRNIFGPCDVPTDLGAVVAVSAGSIHTCAVRSDGQLVCFGWNDCGQCDVPTDLGAVVAISAGRHHTCAVRSDQQLVCFGTTPTDNAMCRRIWEQLWQSQQAKITRVQ